MPGVHPLAPSLDTVGTLAKSVAMAARGLGIIAGDVDQVLHREGGAGRVRPIEDPHEGVQPPVVAADPGDGLGEGHQVPNGTAGRPNSTTPRMVGSIGWDWMCRRYISMSRK